MPIDIAIVLSTLSLIIATVLGTASFLRNKKTDDSKDVQVLTEIKKDVEYIKISATNIQDDLKIVADRYDALDKRLYVVEKTCSFRECMWNEYQQKKQQKEMIGE